VTVVNGKFRALNERSRMFTLKVEAARQPADFEALAPARQRQQGVDGHGEHAGSGYSRENDGPAADGKELTVR